MVFNVFWTILLGVIGGIVSSLIVSRVFLIQNKYQEQLAFVTHIIQKLNYISAFLQSAKVAFEVSYDQDIEIDREMQEKGYKSEMEYYYAHKEIKWIKMSDLLDSFKKEIDYTAGTIKNEIIESHITDVKMNDILQDLLNCVYEVSSVKELSFSSIRDFIKKEQALQERFDECSKASGKMLFKLILKDKLMMVLFIIVTLLLVGTIVTGLMNI